MTRPPTGWDPADFKLVSTDGHEFIVSSALLLSVSGVFRDAESLAGDAPKEVCFIDAEFESSSVIKTFLHLAATDAIGDEGTLLGEDELDAYIKLSAFLRKYDCTELMQQYPLQIQQKLEKDEITPQHVFILGAVLDDVELCVLALKRRTTGVMQGGELLRIGAPTIVVGDIPPRFRRFVPEAFWFGLMEARRQLDSRSLIPTKRSEWDDISVDFKSAVRRLKR